jgi:hypothetical protein
VSYLRDARVGRVRSHLEKLYQSSYRHRRPVTLAIYALIAVAAYALAFLFRFDFAWPARVHRRFSC